MLGLLHFEQELELLRKELIVLREVVAEERERLDERPSPGHDLRAAVGDEVDDRELLKDADRIVRADDVDGTREPDVAGASRSGTEHDRRRGDDVVRAMVLADAEDLEPQPVGELDLLEEIAHPLAGRHLPACLRIGCQLTEGVDTELHRAPYETRNARAFADRSGARHASSC